MSQFPLHPAASPVDIFAAPEVRRQSGGSQLFQLADALNSIRPEVQRSLEHREARLNEASQRQGQLDAMRYESEDAFKAAVDRGDIKETDNPWYRVGLQSEFARVQTRRAALGFKSWYESDPGAADIRNSNGPGPLDAAINSHFAPLIQGKSAWEQEAMLPEIQQFKTQMLNKHLDERAGYLKQERQQTFLMQARSAVTGITGSNLDLLDQPVPDVMSGDPQETSAKLGAMTSAEANVRNTATQLKGYMDEAKKTMSPLEVSHLTAKAVMDVGEASGDPRLAKAIMSRIPSSEDEKKTLADQFQPQLLDHQTTVQNLLAHRLSHEKAIEEYGKKKMMEQALPALVSARDKGEPIQPILKSLPLALRVDVANNLQKLVSDEHSISKLDREDKFDEALNSTVNNVIDKADPGMFKDWRGVMLLDSDRAAKFKDAIVRAKEDWPRDTTPAGFRGMYESAQKNRGFVDYDTLNTLQQNHQISEGDFRTEVNKLVTHAGKEGDPQGFMDEVNDAQSLVSHAMIATFVKNGSIFAEGELPKMTGGESRVFAVAHQFRDAASRLMAEKGQSMSFLQRRDALQQLADQYLQQNGGMTSKDSAAWTDRAHQQDEYNKFVDRSDRIPLTSLDDIAVTPSSGEVPTFYQIRGLTHRVVDSTNLPLMFTDLKDLSTRGPQVAAYLQLSKAAAIQFNADQKKRINGNSKK